MKFPDLNHEIVILDGAMGTMLQKMGMKPGTRPELLNIEKPEWPASVHEAYAKAGSRIVCANTFGANRLKLKNTGYTVEEIIEAGIQNAKKAVQEQACVALDIGPLGELLEPMGSLTFEEACALFAQEVKAGAKAGADCILIETMSDLYETKAALLAAKENSDLPVLVCMTFEKDGRTFTGCTIESMAATLEGLGADAIGFNCSTGPDITAGFLKQLTSLTHLPVIAKPNAGLPDPVDGHYDMDADEFSRILSQTQADGVSVFGGCCGTTPEYIAKLSAALKDKKPAAHSVNKAGTICTPSHPVRLDQPRVIGERINPTGKKRFQKALLEKDLDYIVSVALEQKEAGADLLDVNVGFPGVDEEEILPSVVRKLQSVIDLPLQLDSSNPEALKKAMRIYNGKPAINSVNGKDEVLDALLPSIKKYGAAVVGLALDEEGIPKTWNKRVEIARKILERAQKEGISKEDVWIDPLCLTVSAQQDQARQTLQAIRFLHGELGLHTVLGVSNISFGLPQRALINRTFLVQALEEGLSLAILNPNVKESMDAIAAFKVLNGDDPASTRYLERFALQNEENGQQKAPKEAHGLSLEEAVEKGLQKEAASVAQELLEKKSELEIVEQNLIPALDTVGEKYEKGILFLPQLLSAAMAAQSVFEVLKTSLALKGEESVSKGTIVLATVQGDIHDIGKNIVKTVLENYGFKVIDLGKDTDPMLIVDTVKKENIKLVGLSALMTTTLPAMEKTTKLLKQLDHPPFVMVGGAVVTEEYARSIGADFYARDAKESASYARKVFENE